MKTEQNFEFFNESEREMRNQKAKIAGKIFFVVQNKNLIKGYSAATNTHCLNFYENCNIY